MNLAIWAYFKAACLRIATGLMNLYRNAANGCETMGMADFDFPKISSVRTAGH